MTSPKFAKVALILAAASLSACSTVSMPNLDFLKGSDFTEEAENIGDYPSVSDTPTAPTDIRSAALWDIEAKKLMRERDAFKAGQAGLQAPTKSEAELEREAAALRAKARAYKADDPQ